MTPPIDLEAAQIRHDAAEASRLRQTESWAVANWALRVAIDAHSDRGALLDALRDARNAALEEILTSPPAPPPALLLGRLYVNEMVVRVASVTASVMMGSGFAPPPDALTGPTASNVAESSATIWGCGCSTVSGGTKMTRCVTSAPLGCAKL